MKNAIPVIVAVALIGVIAGVLLGMLGGGGAILTVPTLRYVAGLDANSAIMGSLFVVAVTAAVALVGHARAGNVRWKDGLLFGAAGMLAAMIAGRASHAIPDGVLLALFAAMMVTAAIAMLRRKAAPSTVLSAQAPSPWGMFARGAAVGGITGLVGAGGGFIIVPALLVWGRMPMRAAIGTSLLVIFLNSTAGLVGHLGQGAMAWTPTLTLTATAVVGSVIGLRMGRVISPDTLRRGFAIFVLCAGLAMAAAQLL